MALLSEILSSLLLGKNVQVHGLYLAQVVDVRIVTEVDISGVVIISEFHPYAHFDTWRNHKKSQMRTFSTCRQTHGREIGENL